jgi:hypothetical protein
MNCCAVQRSIALGFAASPGGSATSTSFRSPPVGISSAGAPGGAGTVFVAKLVV